MTKNTMLTAITVGKMPAQALVAEAPHPGTVLFNNFITPNRLTIEEVATRLGLPLLRLQQIVRNERRINGMMALRLGSFFETSPDFWLELQARYDAAHPYSEDFRENAPCEQDNVPSVPCIGIAPGMSTHAIRQFLSGQ